MTNKIISLNEESYMILKKLKRENESFSDLILRLCKKKVSGEGDPLLEYAGVFSDDEFWEDFEGIIKEVRNSHLTEELEV